MVKTVGVCDTCGRTRYTNDSGYCKRCNKEVTNEDIVEEEEEF